MTNFDIFDIFNFCGDGVSIYGGGTVTNLCFTTVGSNGNDKGYEFGAFGSIEPDRTADGKLIYAMVYDNVANTGRINIGATGNEQTSAATSLFLTGDAGTRGMFLTWNSTTLQYEGFDQDFVTWFETQVAPICLSFMEVPDGLIDWNLNLEFGA